MPTWLIFRLTTKASSKSCNLQNTGPIDPKVRGAFLCLLLSGTLQAAPFLTQDQNPFSLINGQPQPVPARLPATGEAQWSLSLDITNTLNIENGSQESILLDYEAYVMRYGVLYGLADNWALMLDIPLIDRGGGFLDNYIDRWHRAFNLQEADRPNVGHDRFQITYENNGTTEYDIGTSAEGLGDIQIGLGHRFHQNTSTTAGIWLVADLPTGDRDRLTGNDALDISALVTGAYRINARWDTDANLGLLFPGSHQFGALESKDAVLFGHAGVSWAPHPLFDLRIQFGGHTQYYSGSNLRPLSSALNIVFGGTLHLGKCSDLDLAVSEDIRVGVTPDVSFLFSWRSRVGDCPG